MAKDSLPTIAVNPEDAGRHVRRGRGRPRSGSSSSSPMLFVNAILVVLVAGLAAAGWFIFNQQEQIASAQELLATAGERIEVLEQRLRLTDELMSESDTDISGKLTEWIGQVDLLWANYRRHRVDIKAIAAKADKLAERLTRAQGSIQGMGDDLAVVQSAVSSQRDVASKVNELDLRTKSMVQQQRNLADKANSAHQIATSLRDSLASKVEDNATAIRAIDAHRLQVNNDIVNLRRDLDSLRRRSP